MMFKEELQKAQENLSGKRIGVLMGGYSSEREISISSGKAIVKSLLENNYNAEEIIIDRCDVPIQSIKECDVVFPALHGKGGEDGAVQGLLEWFDVPYVGSGILGNSIALNKFLTKNLLNNHGVPTPTYSLNNSQDIKLPLVVKANTEGSTIGLEICKTEQELENALKKLSQYDELLFEELIEGRELTVAVLIDKPLDVVEIIPEGGFYDYKHKYKKGLTKYICPAILEKETEEKIKEYALIAHQLCYCSGMSRSDFILGKDSVPYFLEINTIPGFTETSLLPKAAKSCGLEFIDVLLLLLNFSLERKNR